jgi:hypothetical protein
MLRKPKNNNKSSKSIIVSLILTATVVLILPIVGYAAWHIAWDNKYRNESQKALDSITIPADLKVLDVEWKTSHGLFATYNPKLIGIYNIQSDTRSAYDAIIKSFEKACGQEPYADKSTRDQPFEYGYVASGSCNGVRLIEYSLVDENRAAITVWPKTYTNEGYEIDNS